MCTPRVRVKASEIARSRNQAKGQRIHVMRG